MANPFVKESFTRDFMCLPFTHSVTTPSSQMTVTLEYAGLGKKKVAFSSNDKHADVIEKIFAVYPRLKECGLFTMHKGSRGGNNQSLVDVKLNSYDVVAMRKVFKGRTIVYIRPLQKDLSLLRMNREEVSKKKI